MKVIYKYELFTKNLEFHELALPKGTEILRVGMQHSVVTLWALIDPDEGVWEVRRFVRYGTGHEVHGVNLYIGTVFDGPFVWHIFEYPEIAKPTVDF